MENQDPQIISFYEARRAALQLPYEAERHDLMAHEADIKARLHEIDDQLWSADYQRRQAAMHRRRRDEIMHQVASDRQAAAARAAQPSASPAGTFEFPHGGDAA